MMLSDRLDTDLKITNGQIQTITNSARNVTPTLFPLPPRPADPLISDGPIATPRSASDCRQISPQTTQCETRDRRLPLPPKRIPSSLWIEPLGPPRPLTLGTASRRLY
jgi:hypothetical protein